MQGAREYAGLFETKQYGNLFITTGSHARGYTFHIQIIPDGEKAVTNYGNMATNENAVEVYGIISGHPGWTETYGWKHKGPWQADFEKLVVSMRMAKEEQNRMNTATTKEIEEERQKKTKAALDSYVSRMPEKERE
jgi:hypothetical protein